MLTNKAIISAVAVAFVAGWTMRELNTFWAWPMALAIVIAAWWVFGQRHAPVT